MNERRYYDDELAKIVARLVPPGLKVLEIGPVEGSAEELPISDRYDSVVLAGPIGSRPDIWRTFRQLRKISHPDTTVVITHHNGLWNPRPSRNRLSRRDIVRFLELADLEVARHGAHLLLPFRVPLLSWLLNRCLAPLPGLRRLCLLEYIVARPRQPAQEYSVSVIVACRNEVENIDPLLERLPAMGTRTEIIFVDGLSSDGTVARIEAAIERYRGRKTIRLLHQGEPTGKADAVHIGFREARGDILMILDADITVQPEDLTKFYLALAEGRGQFIYGSRLAYPMEKGAMRFLNLVGNKLFAVLLGWIIGQPVRDGLCGTRAFFRRHYAGIMSIRDKVGAIDPFGDFELLFGAWDRSLRIVELPVRYGRRTYGVTKISRFRQGFQLLKMCWTVCRKLKF